MDPSRLPLLQARLSLPDVNQFPTSRLQVEMLVVIYFTAALAYCTYGLRMYSRFNSKQLGLEDWLMTAATITSMAYMTVYYFYLRYSFAGFADDPTSEGFDPKAALLFDPRAALLMRWVSQLLYTPILGLVKSSTLVFLLRITGHVRNIKSCIHVVNIINICLTLAMGIVWVFCTIPVHAYWDQEYLPQRQINHAAFIMTIALLTILTDFLVLAIPFWAFMRTQLPMPTKLGVVMIFMAGGLVTALGIVRFCVLAEQFWEPPPGRFMNTWGPIYAAIEPNVAILTGCLPALRPLLRQWFPNQFEDSSTGEAGASEPRRHYALSTSGNDGSIRMHDFSHKRGNVRSGSNSTTESHEQLFPSAGIRKTTDIHVSYSTPITTPITQNFDETGRKDTPRPSDQDLVG